MSPDEDRPQTAEDDRCVPLGTTSRVRRGRAVRRQRSTAGPTRPPRKGMASPTVSSKRQKMRNAIVRTDHVVVVLLAPASTTRTWLPVAGSGAAGRADTDDRVRPRTRFQSSLSIRLKETQAS
jgi:hypothetical protein